MISGTSAALGLLGLAYVHSPAAAQDFVIGQGQVAGQQIMAGDGDIGSIVAGGQVSTSGLNEFGVGMAGSGQSLLISSGGTIVASGNSADGVLAIGNNASISNEGSILMLGGIEGYGIAATGQGAQISNSGSIDTQSTAGIGILATGATTTIDNSGTISANGTAAFGIISDGASASIGNSGTISATGLAGTAVIMNGNTATLVNSGALLSDLGSEALIVNGDGSTVRLEGGTRIQGGILFTGVADQLVIGPSLNTMLRIDALPANIDTLGMPAVLAGNYLAVLDTTGFEAESTGLASVASLVRDVVDRHYPGVSSSNAWVSTVGGFTSAEAQGSGASYETAHGGVVAGVDGIVSPGLRMGLLAGALDGEASSAHKAQKIKQTVYLAGMLGSLHSGPSFADAALLAGLGDMSSTRLIANNEVLGGLQHGTADYQGSLFQPSLTLGRHVQAGSVTLTPSVRASYTATSLEGFTEAGGADGLSVGKRQADSFDLRGQLQLTSSPRDVGEGFITAELRIGGGANWQRLDDFDAILLQQAIRVDSASRWIATGFGGAGITYVHRQGVSVRISAEAATDSHGNFSSAGRISLIAGFGATGFGQ